MDAHKIEDNNVWNLNRIGGCYYLNQKSDYDAALKWFLDAYKIEDNNAWNLNRIGDCYYFNDNYNTALEWYLKAHKIDDNNTQNINDIGECYIRGFKDYSKALDFYLKAKKIEPPGISLLQNISLCYFKLDEKDKYNEYLTKCLETEPKDVDYYGKLGVLGIVTINFPFAKENFEKAIKLDDNVYNNIIFGHFYLIEGKKEKAIEFYKKSINDYRSDKKFFLEMEEDYEYLSPHGITEADYESVLDTLRQFCTSKKSD